jgi:AcrR family transcriptional regulator
MDYRQRITEEAANMFRTYGIRAVTMDMLAGQLGISKRTIYEIFRDKDELLRGVLKFMGEKQQELIKKVFGESENVVEAIFTLLDLMSAHFKKMSPAFKLDMEKYHNDILKVLRENDQMPYYIDNAEMLKRGIREGVFREDIDIDVTNNCIYEVMKMSVDKDRIGTGRLDKEVLIKDFYLNYLRGISTSEGLRLIDFYEKNQKTNNQTDFLKDKLI